MSEKCCSSSCGCECGPESGSGLGSERGARRLEIELLFLDVEVCERCKGTDGSLEEAISAVADVLAATGTVVVLTKTHVTTEEQAREAGLVTSPTIRVNGVDIQLGAKETLCESCGDLCGEDVDCRVWTYKGEEYTVPPKGMIIDAILKEVYSGAASAAPVERSGAEVPENLKRFFAARAEKDGSGGCC